MNSMAPGKGSRGRKKINQDNESSDEEEYRKKRDRNNLAVKRSRVKSRQRTQETLERVEQLKRENDQLQEKIKHLGQELAFLKEIFIAQAGSSGVPQGVNLEALFADTEPTSDKNPGFFDS